MRWLFRSLSVRLFLIVLGGVLIAIELTNRLHHHDRAHFINTFHEHIASEHLSDIIRLLAALPPDTRMTVLKSLAGETWLVEFNPSPANFLLSDSSPELAKELSNQLGKSIRMNGTWFIPSENCRKAERQGCNHTALAHVYFEDGNTLGLGYRIGFHERPHTYERFGFSERMAIFIAIMAIVSWVVVRLAMRPLQRLSQTAENLGTDISHPPMDTHGPIELQRAARTFNAMQARIQSYMAERTQILAAITHDLKTPLTRMRLRIENCMDESLRERLQNDLTAMQALVEEGLELARSLESSEAPQKIELNALLQSLCDDSMDAGLDVVYHSPVEQLVLAAGKPYALRRIFENIIDNAIKYGQCARVSLAIQGTKAVVRIDDNGPGIPDEHLTEVLKPFVRLENSRSRETGGAGLGLTIAQNLLKSMHGSLLLHNRTTGGLSVIIKLSIALNQPDVP